MVSRERRVIDVNVLAIFLVADHPGNEYVTPVVEEGLRGGYVPLVMDILPSRAFWVMTRRWDCPERESAEAVKHFVREYEPQYFCLQREATMRSFQLAEELNHDVYDCVYLASALQEKATAIVTTDMDFEGLCPRLGLEYVNPVPVEVLRRFRGWRTDNP